MRLLSKDFTEVARQRMENSDEREEVVPAEGRHNHVMKDVL